MRKDLSYFCQRKLLIWIFLHLTLYHISYFCISVFSMIFFVVSAVCFPKGNGFWLRYWLNERIIPAEFLNSLELSSDCRVFPARNCQSKLNWIDSRSIIYVLLAKLLITLIASKRRSRKFLTLYILFVQSTRCSDCTLTYVKYIL